MEVAFCATQKVGVQSDMKLQGLTNILCEPGCVSTQVCVQLCKLYPV